MKLTENQKETIIAIRRSLESFEKAYEQLENDDDCVDIDTIVDNEFATLSENEYISDDISILKDELFDVLTSVEQLNYEEF